MAVSLLLALTLLFWLSIFKLYPRYLAYLSRRFSYYVFEDESVSVTGAVRDWVRDTVRRRITGSSGGEISKAVSSVAGEL